MKYVFIIPFLFPTSLFAIEAVSPESTCERFYSKSERKNCLEKIKKLQPDSYLSAVCERQFDDDAFYECLETAGYAAFDPIKVSKCDDAQFSDHSRLECVRSVADYSQKNEGQSQRTPASSGKLKKKKKKKTTTNQ